MPVNLIITWILVTTWPSFLNLYWQMTMRTFGTLVLHHDFYIISIIGKHHQSILVPPLVRRVLALITVERLHIPILLCIIQFQTLSFKFPNRYVEESTVFCISFFHSQRGFVHLFPSFVVLISSRKSVKDPAESAETSYLTNACSFSEDSFCYF